MSWEGGVDLVALTDASLPMPNVIVHIARMVHTPVGSAPSGMILWQPDPTAPPHVMGFVSTDAAVGAYFGPHIFADTPFEHAPVLLASFDFRFSGQAAWASCRVGETSFEVNFELTGSAELIQRAPQAMPPFFQQGVEQPVANASLRVNGVQQAIILPPVGISGGAAAVCSPNGVYAR